MALMKNPLVLFRIARASLRLVKAPDRLDEVIAIADELGESQAFEAILAYVQGLPGGPAALAARPRVTIDLPRLRALPEGTFGRATAQFLDSRGLDPNDLPHRPDTDGPSWLRAHLFETHDLWHVATGFDTDVAGEAGLQAFYLAQFPARLSAILLGIVMVNTFVWKFDEKDARMDAITHGWKLGRDAQPFIGVRWADLWELPLAEVRARLGVAPVATAIAA